VFKPMGAEGCEEFLPALRDIKIEMKEPRHE
jgi:hypothetical protein